MDDYELWDSRPTANIACSQLFRLMPIGFATPDVESLANYVLRLAVEHGLFVSMLATGMILPLLKQTSTYSNLPGKYELAASWWRNCSSALNGLVASTEDWVQAVQYLTLRTDLLYLTMLPWESVLPYAGLLRRMLAWCPECFEEARLRGENAYSRLIWSLETIRVCVHHKRRLQVHCPYPECGKEQTILAPHAYPGFCHYCCHWLGNSAMYSTETSLSEEDWAREQSIVVAVGELLAIAPTLEHLPNREVISKAIAQYVEQSMNGNLSEFGRQLGVSKRTALELRRGTQLPQLPTLLNICALMNTTPLALLTQNTVQALKTVKLQIVALNYEKRPPRPFDETYLRSVLEAILRDSSYPPPSMKEVAKRLDFDASLLHGHFPELCSEISARFLQYEVK